MRTGFWGVLWRWVRETVGGMARGRGFFGVGHTGGQGLCRVCGVIGLLGILRVGC